MLVHLQRAAPLPFPLSFIHSALKCFPSELKTLRSLVRMRICFQRFSSEDNDLYRGQVHEAGSEVVRFFLHRGPRASMRQVLTHLCFVPVSEDKAQLCPSRMPLFACESGRGHSHCQGYQ